MRCWCGSPCKVKEVTDFSDKFGLKFFMCPNHEHDPPVAESPYKKAPVCFIRDEESINMLVYSSCFTIFNFLFLVSFAPMRILPLD